MCGHKKLFSLLRNITLFYLNYFFKAIAWSFFLLSQNLNWSEDIDGIVNSKYKKKQDFKKFKDKIGREHFSKSYFTFIRPTHEYASIVWGGCFVHDADKLEKV